jgi:hypothetical protein
MVGCRSLAWIMPLSREVRTSDRSLPPADGRCSGVSTLWPLNFSHIRGADRVDYLLHARVRGADAPADPGAGGGCPGLTRRGRSGSRSDSASSAAALDEFTNRSCPAGDEFRQGRRRRRARPV